MDIETLKQEIRKLSSAAVKAKMDLHDLTEELPLGWETIPELSKIAFEVYRELADKKAALKQLENASS
ncbi:MAG: hypothetical protein H6686_12890 [Fibrobacteria bacterium]|nr:hypothetical protein [Fibrobacteria bacterium]